MYEQIYTALSEKRTKAKNAAKKYITVRLDKRLASSQYQQTIFKIQVKLEVMVDADWGASDDILQAIKTAQWDEVVYTTDCHEISDLIYDSVATKFPNREVIIVVMDNNSGSTVIY